MLIISWIEDLLVNLPNFLAYVVPGYVFISVYRYVRYLDHDATDHVELLILNSVAISAVMAVIFDTVAYSTADSVRDAMLNNRTLMLIVLGGVFGLLFNVGPVSKLIDKVTAMFGVNRTRNENIWDDVLEPGIWIRIWRRDSLYSYLGQIKYIEDHGREPIIVLEYYQYLDEDNNVIADNSEDPGRTIMLNLAGFERAELTVVTQQN